jgi:hypothetical protein
MSHYDRATIEPRGEQFRVYLWGHYAQSSVLAGQPLRVFHGDFATVKLAQIAIGQLLVRLPVEVLDQPSMKPYVSVSHLPGEDDPVPGGMYPDDYPDVWPPEP